LLNLAIGWGASWGLFAKPISPVELNLDYISVIDLSAVGLAQLDHVFSQPNAGTLASPALPNHVTVATTHRTALRGKSFRGRSFWIGLAESQVTANTVASGTVSSIGIFWENARLLDSSPTADFWRQVVLSYVSNGAVRATPVATPVTSFSTNPTIDSQRRRLPGRGR